MPRPGKKTVAICQDVHKVAKFYALYEGKTVEEWVEELILEKLNKNKKLKVMYELMNKGKA